MVHKGWLILASVVALVLCLAGPDVRVPAALAAEGASAAAEARALVMERCTLCHGTRPICQVLGKKGKDGWDRIVTRMVHKGAPVGIIQKALVVDWLWRLPAGSALVCPGRK